MPELIAQYGLLLVAIIIFAGEIGLPTLIPGEIAILIVGSQVIHSVPALLGTLALFAAVDILATSTIHLASRTGGNRLLLRLLRFLQRDHDRHEEIIERWRGRLCGRDSLVVFVTRLIPMFRLYASITTGLIRIRFRDFIIGVVPASTIWAASPLILGYLLRSQIHHLTGQFTLVMHDVVIGSVAASVLAAAAYWVCRGGSLAANLRRLRMVLGTVVIGGTAARLFLVLLGDRIGSGFLAQPPSLPVWVGLVSWLGLGLVWLVAQDFQTMRRYQHRPHEFEVLSVVAWASLVSVLGLVAAGTGVHYTAL